MVRYVFLMCLAVLAGCGTVDYDNAPVGRFSGSLFVMWVGEGSDTEGDGRFVFVPAPGAPLVFERNNPAGTLDVIAPEMMYTDGGSIPKPGQLFRGLSPWGYAPAYMVHDWLFVARHCLTDGMATPIEQGVEGMPFEESAEIISEALQTLIAERRVRPDDVAPKVIAGAVAGPISLSKWNASGVCAPQRVTDQHRAEVEAALNKQLGRRVPESIKLPDGDTVPIEPARIVSQISF
ncbi:hypothetical protein [Shimia abyssi]|uniref:DUF1353 domain-containing protein n=1 Tax=Shimia abyssi TaxID=1662395 RepID=A0A2P8FKB2_9RHOB|nr:hypothetical protein [Shimia abyssi]PSL22156.1 hypothetical protein CLV88_101581 [Shimia abyssi]